MRVQESRSSLGQRLQTQNGKELNDRPHPADRLAQSLQIQQCGAQEAGSPARPGVPKLLSCTLSLNSVPPARHRPSFLALSFPRVHGVVTAVPEGFVIQA